MNVMIHCYLHSCFQSIFSRFCWSANDQRYTLTSEEGQGLDWFCFWTIADDSGRVMEGRCCHYVVDGCRSNVINASWKDFPHVTSWPCYYYSHLDAINTCLSVCLLHLYAMCDININRFCFTFSWNRYFLPPLLLSFRTNNFFTSTKTKLILTIC